MAVPINRDFDFTYRMLADPQNYPRWSPLLNGLFEPADDSGYSFRVDLPRGRRIMKFCFHNSHGVLDYHIISESNVHEYTAYLRLAPNDDGCVLVAHYLQRPGLSDEAFMSELEWTATDIKSLGGMIEAL